MIKIKVPATSANIGPGFDCLGLALNLYNTFIFEELDSGLVITGCEDEFKNEDNLIYRSFKYVYQKYNITDRMRGLKIGIDTQVPVCRGLGSSATCIIAGVLAANVYSGLDLSTDELVLLATEIEGHPDNVVPALLGNMTTAILEGDKVYADIISTPDELIFCALVPNFRLSTEKSRGVLPKEVDYKDAVFNIGRVSLLVSAMQNNRVDLIKPACKDLLHQPYRSRLIDGYDLIFNKAEDIGFLGVFLSGAGPTIMALTTDETKADELKDYVEKMPNGWRLYKLNIDKDGALIEGI